MLSAPVLLFFLLLSPQASASCADVSSCRAAALEAQARRDFETFHDLAWLAYRKGRPDDAELMLLLARAQSLSGRPTDALVMLERVMARGISTDAATSEDFARVRALPRWSEIAGERAGLDSRPPVSAKASADRPAEKPSSEPRTPSFAPRSPSSEPRAPSPEPRAPSRRATDAPLSFTTLLKPSALAYDAVSKRYLIADRAARRVAVVDESSGQVTTFVGAQGALGEIGGIAIDPQQGDLWVVSSTPDGDALHRLQLVSGRVISTVPLKGSNVPLVGLTFVRGSGLVGADSSGTIWRIDARGRLEQLAELEYSPTNIASDSAGRLYVSASTSRLARFSISPRPGAREVLTLPVEGLVSGGMAIAGGRLHFLAERDGAYEIRSVPLKR